MPSKCPACDADLDPKIRFCANCGREVAPPPEKPAAPPPRPPPPPPPIPIAPVGPPMPISPSVATWTLLVDGKGAGTIELTPGGTIHRNGLAAMEPFDAWFLAALAKEKPGETGRLLYDFFREELPRVSRGQFRGRLEPIHPQSLSRYRSSKLPEVVTPGSMLAGTRDGSIAWSMTSDGGGFKTGAVVPGGQRWVTLSLQAPGRFLLIETEGMAPKQVIRQRNWWFVKCTLSDLWNAVVPEPLDRT